MGRLRAKGGVSSAFLFFEIFCLAGSRTGSCERANAHARMQGRLRMEGEAQRPQACYLYPPMRSYTEHASGCLLSQ